MKKAAWLWTPLKAVNVTCHQVYCHLGDSHLCTSQQGMSYPITRFFLIFFLVKKKQTVNKTKDNFFSKRILIIYYRGRVQHLRRQSHRRGLMNIRGNRPRADDKASTCTEHTPTRFPNCFDLLETFSGYSTFLSQKTKMYFLTSFRLKERQSLHETMDMT